MRSSRVGGLQQQEKRVSKRLINQSLIDRSVTQIVLVEKEDELLASIESNWCTGASMFGEECGRGELLDEKAGGGVDRSVSDKSTDEKLMMLPLILSVYLYVLFFPIDRVIE